MVVWNDLPLFPPSASTTSSAVDHLYFFLLGVSGFFATLICVLVVFFAAKYRRRVGRMRAEQTPVSLWLEVTWTAIPLLIALSIFGWGARLYAVNSRSPQRALDVLVTAKQWTWKLQHPTGPREIDELHVPLGTKVRLTMTSEDVIHSFFVPAFRRKQDVLPGRYTEMWFEATKVGTYHLFCAEYCGTKHSGMIGHVFVLEPEQYEAWLASQPVAQPPQLVGRELFESLRCDQCHKSESQPRGPSLVGVFGRETKLRDGSTVTADATYLRESIVRPMAKLVAGYEPTMPSYEGQVSEDELAALVAYLESLERKP